ncbi:hypothetical protein [Pendulispora albinea]|uniref:Uncharacterized protein n=1 Tax=Pendulispora albinea TaxID=2741071 RepID=A0ABZ2M464_9BACT
MRVAKPGYTSLLEQEWQLAGDADRAKTILPDRQATELLVQSLSGLGKPPPNPAKGALGIGLLKGACPTEGGATVRVDTGAAGDAGADAGANANIVVYFKGLLPSNETTTQADAVTPTVMIYNIAPGEGIEVMVIPPPDCKVEPFPVADPAAPNITYTGKIKVEPIGDLRPDAGTGANVTSFARVVLSKK